MSEAGEIERVQTVDAVPVFAPESQGHALVRSATPAAQAVAVAASGFVAGAAVVGLAARRRGKRTRGLAVGRRRRKGRSDVRKGGRAGELMQIVASRSLLVDVHLLDGAGRER